jgi:uncharacterized membrane protein YsdA (DUF1294 family)
MGKRVRPETYHGGVALALSAGLVVLLFLVFRPGFTWFTLLAAWLTAINLVAFGYYGYDKARARDRRSRVPEVVLHGLALAGGTLGAYLGMVLFRHKTLKGPFRVVFWVTVVLQAGLVAAAAYRIWKTRA